MSARKDIQRIVRLSPLARMKFYHLLCYYSKQKRMRRIIAKNSGDYLIDKALMRDAMVRYHWDFDEFYMYDYAHLTSEERHSYVSEYDKNVFCDKVNDAKSAKIFDSKWQSYLQFKEFYQRDCFLVTARTINSREAEAFFKKHLRFFLKPDSSASGRGIVALDCENIEDAKKRVLDCMKNKRKPFILEEVVHQSKEMADFHPSSVNSIRMRTFRFDDRVVVLPCNMRLGMGGAVVDNTGRGGISVALDKNGYAFAASNEAGEHFDVHPDTGKQILGRKAPCWEDAVEFVKRLALVVPSVRYVGWDIALTDHGWILIEGNDKGMFVGIQKPTHKGFRPGLEKILSEMNIKL